MNTEGVARTIFVLKNFEQMYLKNKLYSIIFIHAMKVQQPNKLPKINYWTTTQIISLKTAFTFQH